MAKMVNKLHNSTSTSNFRWTFLLSNPDPGIRDIIINILSYLSPADKQSLKLVSEDFENFFREEWLKITEGLYGATITFSHLDWANLSWDMPEIAGPRKRLTLSNFNVLMDIRENDDCYLIHIKGPIHEVLLATWKHFNQFYGNGRNILQKIRDDLAATTMISKKRIKFVKCMGRYTNYITIVDAHSD